MKKSKVKYLKCICCEGSFVDAQSLWGMSEEEENEVKEDFRNSICASLIISKKEGSLASFFLFLCCNLINSCLLFILK